MLSVIDRLELVAAQQISQLPCVDAVTLVAVVQQGILARIAHHDFRDVRLDQVVQPGGRRSFLKGDLQVPAQATKKLQNRARFGLDHTFHNDPAGSIPDRDGDAFLVDIQADILRAIHVGRSFP